MSFTSKSPHSCEYCQKITIDLGLDNSAPQFSCGVEEILAADQAGCPLFHAFVESIKEEARLDESSANRCDLSFAMRYEKEDLPDSTAALILSVSGTLDDGTKNVDVNGQTKLVLWTTEGIMK